MNEPDHGNRITDEDLGGFLLELPERERRRLLVLLASRLDPRTLIEPLTEQVRGALETRDEDPLGKAETREVVRRALVETMRARTTHLAQLGQLAQTVLEIGREDVLADKVMDFCRASGLTLVEGVRDLSLFRVVAGSPEHGEFITVLKPACVDESDGRLIVAGEIRFSDVPPEAPSRVDDARREHAKSGRRGSPRNKGKKKGRRS